MLNKTDQKEANKIISEIEELMNKVETLWEEQSEKLDKMSEKMRETEKGDQLESLVNDFELARDALENARDYLQAHVDLGLE